MRKLNAQAPIQPIQPLQSVQPVQLQAIQPLPPSQQMCLVPVGALPQVLPGMFQLNQLQALPGQGQAQNVVPMQTYTLVPVMMGPGQQLFVNQMSSSNLSHANDDALSQQSQSTDGLESNS